ncbi:plasmid stabilization protein [Mesorhizobium sp. C264A]|uniref:plasmid stabilization protein n=1 Tax=Mesorhizobium sp. C264A TaxID=2956825 RepID=UPI003335D4D6
MPRGDKSKYSDKQERKADHIAAGYEKRGVSEKESERRAWATVNKDDGGGKKEGGSGRGKHTGHPAAHKGGKSGGKASASRSAASRSESAKKGCVRQVLQNGAIMKLVMRLGVERASCARADHPC